MPHVKLKRSQSHAAGHKMCKYGTQRSDFRENTDFIYSTYSLWFKYSTLADPSGREVFKVRVCDLSLVSMAGPNPTGGMDVCLW